MWTEREWGKLLKEVLIFSLNTFRYSLWNSKLANIKRLRNDASISLFPFKKNESEILEYSRVIF